MIAVPMTLAAAEQAVPMSVAAVAEEIAVSVAVNFTALDGEPYEGPTEFTPSAEEQVAETRNRVLYENIVIRPIPSNYGLITYNGRIITVS